MPYKNEKLNEYKKYINGKTASVIGVGISNIPLIKFLLDNGVKVVARDKKDFAKLSENPKLNAKELSEKGVKFICGENYLDNINEEIVFKSPGIRFDKEEILNAYKNGAVITSEMEAFLSLCPSKIIAITGSNGKTTTTSVTAEILKNDGKKVWLGGNIGRPLLSEIEKISPDDFTVLELSSFQLHTINRFENASLPFAKITFPDVGVITNISPNHLDWHTDMDEYADAKKAVFSHNKGGKLVINRCSDEFVKTFLKQAESSEKKVETFSVCDGKTLSGASYDEATGDIFVDRKKILNKKDIVLPGLHNVENYMAAILATKDYVSEKAIVQTAKTFPGVPHRMELVKEKGDIKFYNGSIDSSPSRTVAALSCFDKEYDGRINIILGGYDKKIPFDDLAEPILKRKIKAFVTGDTAEKIICALKNSEYYDEKTSWVVRCENFEDAVIKASAAALPGDVVLLSPACASFDEFDNFEKRGEKFKALVEEITAE